MRAQVVAQVVFDDAGSDDVLQEQYGTAGHVEVGGKVDLENLGGIFLPAHADVFAGDRNGDFPREVGDEERGALQDPHQNEALIVCFSVDLSGDLGDARRDAVGLVAALEVRFGHLVAEARVMVTRSRESENGNRESRAKNGQS